jgi:signal transduction histidine kinase/ActR/RegA family two-component response regulator
VRRPERYSRRADGREAKEPRLSRTGPKRARLFVLPLLTIAYVLSGRLGLLLAVPPGYASPVFPPAGIAIAAMLIWGRATLPSVILGSFLLNLWVGAGLGQGAGQLIVVALGIGAASALQAAVGGCVLRRAIGYPAALDAGRQVARFLFLAPLCCLVSATLSLCWLAALGAVGGSSLAVNWVSWWIGDTLGVLVLLPLMFVLAGEPRPLWRSRALPMAVPMLSFFVLFVMIFVRVDEWEKDAALVDFRLLSREVVDEVHTAFDEEDIFLEQLNRSFTGVHPLSRADFHHLVGGLLRRFPAIQAVKWAPRIGDTERPAFEVAQQREMPGFAIRAMIDGQPGNRAGAAPFYYPVTYVEPLAGNRSVVGVDLASDRVRRTAIEEAVASERVTATPPLHLGDGNGKEPGTLLLLPVPGGPDGAGVLLVALRVGTLMNGLLAPIQAAVAVELVDLDAGRPLYGSVGARRIAASYNEPFSFGGRRYDLETEPTAAYLAGHRSWQSWGVLVAGVLSTGLLGALLMLGTGYARRIENVVEVRTRDLAAVNRRLQIEIEERQQAEAALRQAQRMEAIGQLTGGIAHDFNNLLTVVRGNAELLHDGASDETVRRRAAAIARAVERGERLTRQLLAFSRPQTPPQSPLDLRQRTQEIGDLLAQSLRSDIAVDIVMPPDLWPVAVDPAEFDLALLNIAVNARDAMPRGGRFWVTARNATLAAAPDTGLSGDFVVITLSDTGGGMTADVQARAFEPYFTTKEAGVGSGLGLSQVYGFAKGSGGAATIDSILGAGSMVTLFLPRAAATPAASPGAAADPVPHAAAARILFVEDDAEVAEATAELLQDLGYRPVAAYDAGDALAALDRDPEIALVLSDIVMPGRLNGLELARTLRRDRPDLPVLLATGYSQYVTAAAKEGFGLVEKPYRRASLAAAIRTAVEQAAAARA